MTYSISSHQYDEKFHLFDELITNPFSIVPKIYLAEAYGECMLDQNSTDNFIT